MENAADALKIAFAVFVFVLAITLTFSIISQAKSTADVVLYHTDKSNFYEYADSKDQNRVVSITEIISTLYKYYDELICITVKIDDNEYVFENGRETIILDTNGSIDSDATTVLNTEEQKDVNLNNFITYLKNDCSDKTFTEEFVEVPNSGIYKNSEDNYSEIVIASGGNKKLYITYECK